MRVEAGRAVTSLADVDADPHAHERFALAMEHAAIGMALTSPLGEFMDVNPALCAMLDRDAAALKAATWQELTHPDDLSADLGLVQDVLAGRRDSYRMKKRYVRPDGSLVWGDLSVAAVRDPDGSVRYFIMQVVDVTRHVETEERYRLLAENGSDVVVLSGPDRVITWASPSVTSMLGWAPGDLVGREAADFVHPDDLVTVDAAAPGLAGDGVVKGEARVRRADGSYVWIGSTSRPLVDGSGVLIGRVSGWRDIDSEREARRALVESEMRFRMMVENASDVVFHSVDGITEWVSPSLTAVTGWLPEEIIGHTTTHLWHPDDLGKAVAIRDTTYAGGVGRGELRCLRKDGSYVWLDVALQPYVEADGRIGAVGILRDIERRVRTQEALARSEEHFRLLAENATDVVVRVRNGRIAWISPSIARALGGRPEARLGRDLADLLHEDDIGLFQTSMAQRGDDLIGVHRVRVKADDGNYHWIEAHTGPYVDADGEEDGAIASFRVIDEVVEQEHELERRARFDDLTGLRNRAEAFHVLGGMVREERRAGGLAALLFCDVDHLRDINATYGHAGGDAVLRAVGERISAAVRSSDTTCRIGGDELLVILDGVRSLDEALAVAEKVRREAAQPVLIDGQTCTPSLSIGVTLLREDETVDELVKRADKAMYKAKASGRNHVIPLN